MMRRKRILTASAATVAIVASTAMIAGAVPGIGGSDVVPNVAGAPDLLLYNGKISTVDSDNTEVQAIAIRNGDIIATGSDASIRPLAKQHTKLVDLKGRRVLPGLIDGHLHGMRESYHCWTQGVRLDLVRSRAQALAMYKAKADELADGKWIWTGGGGWSLSQLDNPTIFTFAELNAAMPKNPAWITGGGVTGPRVNQAATGCARPDRELAGRRGHRRPGHRPPDGRGQCRGQRGDRGPHRCDRHRRRGECLADFIKEANMRGLTAWKDAMGNQAPWSTTGSINQGLHVDESTRQLYRTGKLNARIAYNNMSDAYSLTNPRSRTRSLRSRTRSASRATTSCATSVPARTSWRRRVRTTSTT